MIRWFLTNVQWLLCIYSCRWWLDGQASLLFGWLMQLYSYTSYYLSILSVIMVTIDEYCVVITTICAGNQHCTSKEIIARGPRYSLQFARLQSTFPSFAARLSIRPVCLSSVILLQGLELLGRLSIRKLMHDSLLYPTQWMPCAPPTQFMHLLPSVRVHSTRCIQSFRGSLKLLTSVSTSVLWPHAAFISMQMFLPRARILHTYWTKGRRIFSWQNVDLVHLSIPFISPVLPSFLFFLKPLFCFRVLYWHLLYEEQVYFLHQQYFYAQLLGNVTPCICLYRSIL